MSMKNNIIQAALHSVRTMKQYHKHKEKSHVEDHTYRKAA